MKDRAQPLTQASSRANLDLPRYDQSTYWGRVRYFTLITNPLTLLATDAQIDRAKDTVDRYRAGAEDVSEEDAWAAKHLCDSALHPQTGEKIIWAGRLSFQAPRNTIVFGGMMLFAKTVPAIVFWQWIHQSFNACVNYSNRNTTAPVSMETLRFSYVAATSTSVLTAIGFHKLIKSSPRLSSGIWSRFIPWLSVAASNCVNTPLMRQTEVQNGVMLRTPSGEELGNSTRAAELGIVQVITTRIVMAAPGIFIPPMIVARLARTKAFVKHHSWLRPATVIASTAACLLAAVPACCAIFPQNSYIRLENMEPALQEKAKLAYPGVTKFYFNKGL